uniref:Aminoglycoside phosphotransferase domain-containing protein n=1 Tax=Bionectria ochroleuca TaxID=29856 RepID=A0A8H7N2B6_BIOOC
MPNSISSIESYDSDEPAPLEIDKKQLLACATNILGTLCTSAVPMTRGVNHEVFLLSFEAKGNTHPGLAKAGHRCIARFTRINSVAATRRDASEVATLRYLKRKTDIPVPEVYHQDLGLHNPMGAPYTLMEYIHERHLYKLWVALDLVAKKAVLSQVATVVAKFASLRFQSVGSLHDEGIVGPLITPTTNIQRGPFFSTKEYLLSFVSPDDISSPELIQLFSQIQRELDAFFTKTEKDPGLAPPFAMIHADFDGQNMLFIEQPDGLPPKLAGIIDFEYSYPGPLYFLFEYPIFIQDVSWSKELYPINAILRPHFVREIFNRLPDEESRRILVACMNSKSYTLNSFNRLSCP